MDKLIDLFEQARAAQAETSATQTPIAPDRHPNRDFFIADLVNWALKDDFHSMEHPFFSLSKKKDRKPRHYEHKGDSITITPSVDGLATIWDKDILIYSVSQLVEALNQGRTITRTVQLNVYKFLVATNRSTGGHAYKLLQKNGAAPFNLNVASLPPQADARCNPCLSQKRTLCSRRDRSCVPHALARACRARPIDRDRHHRLIIKA